MISFSVRLPEGLDAEVRQRARVARRTLNSQILFLLELGLQLDGSGPVPGDTRSQGLGSGNSAERVGQSAPAGSPGAEC